MESCSGSWASVLRKGHAALIGVRATEAEGARRVPGRGRSTERRRRLCLERSAPGRRGAAAGPAATWAKAGGSGWASAALDGPRKSWASCVA